MIEKPGTPDEATGRRPGNGRARLQAVDATFFYDLESPYAWLAAERVDSLFDEPPGWVPVLLGGIFKATGRSSWAETDNRAAGIAEIERRIADRGLPALKLPAPWPGNSLHAMRAAVYAHQQDRGREFARAAYRRHFTEAGALDEEGLSAVASQVGLDPDALVDAVQSQDVKDALRKNTERALADGVFGVPTLVVDGEVFWGDDRLEEAVTPAAGS